MSKKKNNYKKAPKNVAEVIVSAKVVDDFVPSPEKLALKENMKDEYAQRFQHK